MIQHHIEACTRINNLKEIIILGYYPTNDLAQFVSEMNQKYKILIRWVSIYDPIQKLIGEKLTIMLNLTMDKLDLLSKIFF